MNKVVFAGSLEFLNLGEVLQLLGSNGSTGILRITSKYAKSSGLIYLLNGNPVNASADSLSGIEAVYSLFGWLKGDFEFTQEQVNVENVIKKSRMKIILNSLSMLDDGVIKKLGPVSFDKISDSSGKSVTVPIIKGPLVDYMYVVDEEEFTDGQEIVMEGKYGNWIWVVLEGVVEIVKKTAYGPVTILRIGEGAFVGSMASFLMEGSVRSATVVANGNVQLGVMDLKRLSIDFSCLSHEFRGLVLSLDKRLKQVTERAVGINIDCDLVDKLIKDNKPIIKQGEAEDKIYIISEGEAWVVRYTDNKHVMLANLCKGDVFGHVPFFDTGHESFSASVYGSNDLKVRTVNSEDLQNEYNNLSSIFKNIVENIATCISVTTRLACNYSGG
ncbi:MAG: cyclic nucleotide-binding domain-containing protein [Deltaproteobacteria bacterium]|nr:cyclic nucleotide-binding domain-containing protein [Deltaproteobacteria bacterium]MBW2661333.1 cyclic nucleotide-binding domain-containing protein [Deltaproteobacteria bacterium]